MNRIQANLAGIRQHTINKGIRCCTDKRGGGQNVEILLWWPQPGKPNAFGGITEHSSGCTDDECSNECRGHVAELVAQLERWGFIRSEEKSGDGSCQTEPVVIDGVHSPFGGKKNR